MLKKPSKFSQLAGLIRSQGLTMQLVSKYHSEDSDKPHDDGWLGRRIRCETEFTLGEIARLMQFLDIDDSYMPHYFPVR